MAGRISGLFGRLGLSTGLVGIMQLRREEDWRITVGAADRSEYVLEAGLLRLSVEEMIVRRVAINVVPVNGYDPENPTVLDVVAYAFKEWKPSIIVTLVKAVGAQASHKYSTHPCSGSYEEYYIDGSGEKIEIVEQVVLSYGYSKRCRRSTSTCCYEESRLYLAADRKGRWYIVYEEGTRCSDVHETWGYGDKYLLPLQPMRIRVVEEGTKVVCGPDGYAEPYGPVTVEEREFPPGMYGL